MTASQFPRLFSPVRIGPMTLKSRVMMPPHFSAIGNLWGTEAEAARTLAYLDERAAAGVAWVTVTGRVGNRFIPGFEPSGLSAETLGFFRLPQFQARMAALTARMAAQDTRVLIQMTMIGGYPNAPSAMLSNPVANAHPHPMTLADIAAIVEEYRFSARQVAQTPLDGVEMHFNHDDLVEQFLSPLTNRREDAYGGCFDNRLRLAVELLQAVRAELPGRVLGVRLNAFQEQPGGIDAAEAVRIARALARTGLIDYLGVVAGSHWGSPSYIQTHHFGSAQWAAMAGAIRQAAGVPVVYAGRVDSPEVAERILTDGQADVVGIARAHVADGGFLAHARAGRPELIRPCIAANDCINRRYVDGLPFGCAVNPQAGREIDGPLPAAARPRRVLVVGGGPAGMELAGLAAESGHDVTLREAAPGLGGQLRLATAAPCYERMAQYLHWQERRLARAGVRIQTGRRADPETVLADGFDVVALATGASPRRPPVPGAETATEGRELLAGRAEAGPRVLVIAEEDHMQPLALADFLATRGHHVTLVYATPTPAILLGRYSIGAPLARLDAAGVAVRTLEQVVAIRPDGAVLRHVYSKREFALDGFDTVALACGGVADSALHAALVGRHPEVHLLGDAFAPRRLVFATRQARALAAILAEDRAGAV